MYFVGPAGRPPHRRRPEPLHLDRLRPLRHDGARRYIYVYIYIYMYRYMYIHIHMCV